MSALTAGLLLGGFLLVLFLVIVWGGRAPEQATWDTGSDAGGDGRHHGGETYGGSTDVGADGDGD